MAANVRVPDDLPQVSRTIWEQCLQSLQVLKARDFVFSDDSLSFRLTHPDRPRKHYRFQVRLSPDDTYSLIYMDLTDFAFRNDFPDIRFLARRDQVLVENLNEVLLQLVLGGD